MITPLVERRQLPDTKARRMRNYDLFLTDGFVADYVLIFRQGKPGLKEYEETWYAVQDVDEGEDAPCGMNPYAEFLILKLNPEPDDPDRDEVYRCIVPAEPCGFEGSCSCMGQNMKRVCKHLDALKDACLNVKVEPQCP